MERWEILLANFDPNKEIELRREKLYSNPNGAPIWRCYLDTAWHYEDFDFVSEGLGDTIEEAVLAAFEAYAGRN